MRINIKKIFKTVGQISIVLTCIPVVIVFFPILYIFNIRPDRYSTGLRIDIHDSIDKWFAKKALAKKIQLPWIDYKGIRYKVGDKILVHNIYKEVIKHIDYIDKEPHMIITDKGRTYSFPKQFELYNIQKIECRKSPSWL
jgi:hypothetical protein